MCYEVPSLFFTKVCMDIRYCDGRDNSYCRWNEMKTLTSKNVESVIKQSKPFFGDHAEFINSYVV